MMDYVLVALLISGPGTYDVEVIQRFNTMAQCRQVLEKKAVVMDNMLSLVCAKKDWE